MKKESAQRSAAAAAADVQRAKRSIQASDAREFHIIVKEAREREGERKREKERERKKEKKSERGGSRA